MLRRLMAPSTPSRLPRRDSRAWSLAVGLAMLGAPLGCSTPASEGLVVNLQSDFVPVLEFGAIEITVDGVEERSVAVGAGASYGRPTFVTTYADLPHGEHVVAVSLIQDGATVASREATIEITGSRLLNVVITRSCSGVSCGEGRTCAGGRCIAPTCVDGTERTCAAPACEMDSDCASSTACVAPRCAAAECLETAASGACEAGEVCLPGTGCVARPEDTDAGMGRDAGILDASSELDAFSEQLDASVDPDAQVEPGDAFVPRCLPFEERPLVEVSGAVTSDTTWDCNHLWSIHRAIDVEGPSPDAPAVLTIEPGTVIVLGTSATGVLGALLVGRQGRLVAEGSASEPITFTSDRRPSERSSGDWGGIVLSGRARLNTPGGESTINALVGSGSSATTCGSLTPDDAWDCGRLRYVRVEFAGGTIAGASSGLAGLTLAACGTGTVVDYLQTHRTADDGLTIYGGRVDLRHVVVSASEEEVLDWNLGWDGRAQFLVGWQLPAGLGGQDAPGQGFLEGDSEDRTPHSSPILYNVTARGAADGGEGLRLQTATELLLGNAIIDARGGGANVVEICGDSTAALTTGPMAPLRITSSLLSAHFGIAEGSCADTFDERGWVCQPGVTCDPMLDLSFGADITAPSFAVPGVLRRVCDASPTDPADGRPPFFDASATFCGAVGTDDWTAGWTEFPAG